jgi:cathepsin A (carboxypeptidase C)
MGSDWYSGYYYVGKSRLLHYIFIESQNKPQDDPIMVYFNGGPGGASTFNVFTGFGPIISTDGSSSFKEWNHTWCKNASVIFLDNPTGVGYSYG